MAKKKMDEREYDQLDALTSSTTMEISRLSLIVRNLRERIESLERNQTELMDKIYKLEKEKDAKNEEDDNN